MVTFMVRRILQALGVLLLVTVITFALLRLIPGNTAIEHLVEVVVKYGSTHPDQTHERFEVLAFTALHDAWPCKR